jgi:hypothetical protein
MTAALALLMTGVGYSHAEAQVRMRDLVFTVGGSVEDYSGNLSAVTVPLVDSTDHAWSAVGEMAVRGQLSFFENANRSMELSFDGGVRQAAAMGFEFRDYSPREWVGTSELRFSQSLGTWGSLGLEGAFRSRSIRDRTPMPLFLQPGYAIGSGAVSLVTRAFEGVSFDVKGQVEEADYTAATFLPQLDLLDRRGAGVEAGARWGSAPANLRVYGGVWWSEYEHQSSFVPEDPFRRDRTVRAGLDWSYFGSAFVQIGVEGTVNRSNSNRPEYDALAISALVSMPMPGSTTLNAFAVLTGKSYVHETDFARLVPGEEADNASLAYLQLVRPVSPNLDGALRLAWTRAETDIGSQYYRRFGVSVEFNYRPLGN